ncbi:hypothetical protein TorRG33x02_226560 [Trema orientale]|uniref:Bowman-Birk serine protease inhibitors family domain-containing protein n=1 Tax=Trema orientale TaxID=63057 RepID=A0A2P5E7K8_TREOI|nr:hypothetical protein TorRG33x02_226560 [Trema orientale]
MALSKVFLALLGLFAAVAVTAHARIDLFGVFDNDAWCPIGPTKCASCECKIESGKATCVRTDERRGDCPSTCGRPCICDRSSCPRCVCSYEVQRCPRICPSSTATMVENFLASESN